MIRDTIKSHADFITEQKEPIARCVYFSIRTKKAKNIDSPRYGLVVSKKSFKLAVQRNRAKRLLRDWIAYNEHLMCKDMDYIFFARFQILQATRTDGRDAMAKALAYVKSQHEKISQ